MFSAHRNVIMTYTISTVCGYKREEILRCRQSVIVATCRLKLKFTLAAQRNDVIFGIRSIISRFHQFITNHKQHATHQPSSNQQTNQQTKQPTNQTINKPNNQQTNPPTNQPTNQLTNKLTKQTNPTNQHNQPTQPTNQQTNQPTD